MNIDSPFRMKGYEDGSQFGVSEDFSLDVEKGLRITLSRPERAHDCELRENG
jgi:hypothetical protein